MARRKKYNPEKRAWRGRSYKKHGEHITIVRFKGNRQRHADDCPNPFDDKHTRCVTCPCEGDYCTNPNCDWPGP